MFAYCKALGIDPSSYSPRKRHKYGDHHPTEGLLLHHDASSVQRPGHFPDLAQYRYDQREQELHAAVTNPRNLGTGPTSGITHAEHGNDAGKLVASPTHVYKKQLKPSWPVQPSLHAQGSSSRTFGRTDESNEAEQIHVNEMNNYRGRGEIQRSDSRFAKHFRDAGQIGLPPRHSRVYSGRMPLHVETPRQSSHVVQKRHLATHYDMPPPAHYPHIMPTTTPSRAPRQRFSSPFFPPARPHSPTDTRQLALRHSGLTRASARHCIAANTSAVRGSPSYSYADNVFAGGQDAGRITHDDLGASQPAYTHPEGGKLQSLGLRHVSSAVHRPQDQLSTAYMGQFEPSSCVLHAGSDVQAKFHRERLTLPPVSGRQYQATTGPKAQSRLAGRRYPGNSPSVMGQVALARNMPIFGVSTTRRSGSAMGGRRCVRR